MNDDLWDRVRGSGEENGKGFVIGSSCWWFWHVSGDQP